MENTFTWLFHATDKVLLFLTDFIATVSIGCIFVITVLKLRNDKPIATDRKTFSQKTDLIKFFETFLTYAFHLSWIILKIHTLNAGDTHFSTIGEHDGTLAPCEPCTEDSNFFIARFTKRAGSIIGHYIRTDARVADVSLAKRAEINRIGAWLALGLASCWICDDEVAFLAKSALEERVCWIKLAGFASSDVVFAELAFGLVQNCERVAAETG